jgi:hypothetical protein
MFICTLSKSQRRAAGQRPTALKFGFGPEGVKEEWKSANYVPVRVVDFVPSTRY